MCFLHGCLVPHGRAYSEEVFWSSLWHYGVCCCNVLLFLYLPILVLILFSFNDSNFPYEWKGFTLRWYAELFSSVEVWDALKNSLIVALSSVVLSLVMGVSAVLYARKRLARRFVLFYGTLAIPEIVVAVGLLSFFSFFAMPFGLVTLIVSHALMGLGYVIPLVYTRFSELDYALTEASMDLGATRTQTYWRVIIPFIVTSAFGFRAFGVYYFA